MKIGLNKLCRILFSCSLYSPTTYAGDLGGMALAVRVIVALVPYDFLAGVFSFAAPYMGDYQKHNKNRGGKKD